MNDEVLTKPVEVEHKPFTIDEVYGITKVPSAHIEYWIRNGMVPLQIGEDKTTEGLDYMPTFAVFVGYKWFESGAPRERVDDVVRFVAALRKEGMLAAFHENLTFPCVVPGYPRILVKADSRKTIGKTLNLRILFREFIENLRRVFPGG